MGLFYFMKEKKFICQTTNIHQLELHNSFKNLVTISIYDKVNNMFLAMELSINETERLMDELHKSIIKAEGGHK